MIGLSGGNQQKVVLGKWLALNPRVLILDEPTRGIDVAAKAEIYREIVGLAERGITILTVSSELEEVIGLCDRVVVMHEGRIIGVVPRDRLTQERVAGLMTGRAEGDAWHRRELGMFVALVCMCAGLWLSNSDFLGHSNAIDTTRQISMLGIYALGIGFVIITGGIDLSIGSVIGLTGVLIAKLSGFRRRRARVFPLVGIPAALGIALLIVFLQGMLITRLRLQPFIVTLGGMLLLRGVSQTVVEGGTLSLGASPLLRLASGGLLRLGGEPPIPYPLLIFAAVAAIATHGQMSQQVGVAYELYAISAAVLGGCSLRGGEGTVLGIVIGSAIMRVIDNGINHVPDSLH